MGLAGIRSLAGLPLGRWVFALRVFLAIHLALGVAFWVQLDGASSAGVTAGILALQTRGQIVEKSLFRLAGTAAGGVAALVIVGLFAQARDPLILAYSAWLGLCVFAAGLFDGNRASVSAEDFATDCPVPLDRLAGIIRADPEALAALLDDLPEATRAGLAVWLYGRSHTHATGVRVAGFCEGAALRRAAGLVGNVLYEQSRRPYAAPDYGSARTGSARRISLGGSAGGRAAR